jgi:hypothetical protein
MSMKECSRCHELFVDMYKAQLEEARKRVDDERKAEALLKRIGVRDYRICPDCREKNSRKSNVLDTYQYTRAPEGWRITEGFGSLPHDDK